MCPPSSPQKGSGAERGGRAQEAPRGAPDMSMARSTSPWLHPSMSGEMEQPPTEDVQIQVREMDP